MNTATRNGYFGRWAAACRVQGWPEHDEAKRREVTLAVTGQASSTKLDNDGISDLFRHLEWLANPDSLDHAMRVVGESPERNRCRQLIWVISGLGFDDTYIERPAATYCERERVAGWRELSSESLTELRNTLKTRARKRDADAGKRDEFVPRAVPYHKRPDAKKKRAEKRAAEREQPYAPRKEVAEALDANLLPF